MAQAERRGKRHWHDLEELQTQDWFFPMGQCRVLGWCRSQGLCQKGREEASAILWYIGNSPAIERGSIISNKQLPSFHGLDFELHGEEAKELSSESLMSRTFRTEKSETFQALN